MTRALEIATAVALAIAAAVLIGLGLAKLNPLSAAHQLPKAEARATSAEDRADVGRLEGEGAAAQAARVDSYHQTAARAVETAHAANARADAAPDADQPLPPDVLARYRRADDELCRLPGAYCSADPAALTAGGDAGGGAAPLRDPDAAAGPADRG